MKPVSLTIKQKNFIKQNRLKMSGVAMAKDFGVSCGIVQRYMRKNGLSVSRELQNKFRGVPNIGKTSSTPKIDKILRLEYLITPSKRLAEKIGRSDTFVRTRMRQLKLVIPEEVIAQRKKDSQIKSGSVPMNKGKKIREYMSPEAIERSSKTRFKKGQKPSNTMSNGIVTIRRQTKGPPYKYIRISEGEWFPYHQHLWIKKYGRYNTRKYCLWFKDGNSMNCDLENLELIPRRENAMRNRERFKSLPDTAKKIIKLNNKLKSLINDSHRKKTSTISE